MKKLILKMKKKDESNFNFISKQKNYIFQNLHKNEKKNQIDKNTKCN